MGSGFLPTRGSPMLDLVVIAMVFVTVLLLFSVAVVRWRKNHRLHRKIQLALALVLLVTIVAFELEVRFLTDWRKLAEPSPWYADGTVSRLLAIHLTFAIPTPFVWGGVIWHALRNYKDGFQNPQVRMTHRWGGRVGTALMVLTAITGWAFYWAAFVA